MGMFLLFVELLLNEMSEANEWLELSREDAGGCGEARCEVCWRAKGDLLSLAGVGELLLLFALLPALLLLFLPMAALNMVERRLA